MTDRDDTGEAGREPFKVRKGPALLVVAIALFIIIVGGVIAALPSPHPATSPNSTAVHVSVGTGAAATGTVEVTAAATALKSIEDNGTLPSDISDSLVVPTGSQVTGHEDLDGNAGQYDRAIVLTAPYRADFLVACYTKELPKLGWTLSGTPANSTVEGFTGTEVLAEHPANDGYYWEVGITIANGKSAITPELAGNSTSGVTSTIHLELFEVPDEN